MLYFLLAAFLASVALLCGAIEPVPQASDIVTIVNRDSPKEVRLDANLYIPDGGELLLNIDVPREQILIDSHAPAKVTRVYSTHADTTIGVGEQIDVLVEFTSAVDVIGAPWLTLATGCHASECHVREIQRLRCQATTGKFAVEFDGQRVVNIPWDASAKQFAQYVQRMTKIDNVVVDYLQQDGKACTYFGNNITVTFESMNIEGVDGDLPEMTADAANANGDGTSLGHVRLTPTLSPIAWEIQKGVRVPDRQAAYVGKLNAQTLQFTYTVRDGDNTTRLEYANTDALTRSVGSQVQIRNTGTLTKADTTLPPPAFAGDWERGMGSSLSANSRIQIDGSRPVITSVSSPHDDGTFGIGEAILVHVQFSLPVVVTGLPTIVLETGQVDRIIPFVQVTGATESIVVFRYVVQARDTTPDLTYTGTTSLKLNGGSIRRKSTTPSTDAILTLPINGERGSLSWTKNIVIDTSDPKITGVSAVTADGTYTGGDSIQVQVAFDTPVVVTGSPQLLLATGSVDLFPGSFVQAAPAGTNSPRTIVFPPVDHGLSTGPSSGLQFSIDTKTYTVSSVGGDAVTMVEDYTGTIVDPTVINGPSIPILSPGYRPARYTSGSGTRLLLFTYDIQRGDSSLDLAYVSTSALLLNGGTIKRLSTSPFSDAVLTLAMPGTSGSLSFSANIVVNTDAPRVLQLNPITRDGTYRAGDAIFLSVVFSLPVVVQNTASLQTTAGLLGERVAVYTSGSGSTTLTFNLECKQDDQTAVLDAFSVKALRPAYGYVSGFIRRQSSAPLIPADLDLPIAGLSSKGISIDQACAFVRDVSTSHEDATAGAGEVVDVVVTYNVPVDVDITGGIPSLQLSSQKTAIYTTGTGSSAVTFRYIVQSDDPRVRVTYVDIFSLQLNGAQIRQTASAKLASTLLPPPLSTVLATQQKIYIDTGAPVVIDVSSRLLDGVYTVGDRVLVVVTLNAPVVVTSAASNRGIPTLYLQLGGSTNVASPATFDSANDNQLYFALTIASGQSTANVAYPTRTSLRCVGSFGLNKDGTLGTAVTPHGVEFQGRLLVLWSEKSTGAVSQIRAKSLNLATPFGSSWVQEDGDGATGRIQFNAAMDATNPMGLAFSATKLYACWQERNGATGNPTQIRIALYLGGDSTVLQRWQFVGRTPTTSNGLNRDPTQSGSAPHLAVHNDRLYMAWHESIPSSAATQIRVALYNGQDLAPSWSFVDGNVALRGINVASSRAAQNVRMVSCRSTLFAVWEEVNSAGISQIRVSSLGGTDAAPRWSNVDGNSPTNGLNIDSTMHARIPSIACLQGTTLVVAWHEAVDIGGGSGTRTRIRAKQALLPAVLTAVQWRSADKNRGVNFDTTQNALNVRLRSHPLSTASLYATWEEVDAASSKSQVRVALFTGGDIGSWTLVDGGASLSMLNDASSQNAAYPVLVPSATLATTWYAAWQETHPTTGTTHARASVLRADSGSIGIWQSLHDRCVLRRSTTPTTSSDLRLPELNTMGSLDFGRQVRIDTARPSVQNVSFASSSRVMAMASRVQTIDVFNRASVTQGQYKLTYDGEESVCIDWNAPIADVKAALEGISRLNLRVDVSMDPSAIQDAIRYTITFAFPTTGIKPIAVIASSTCTAWVCTALPLPRLACNLKSLIVLNANRDVATRGGIVDVLVNFSSPVVVTAGTPQLVLETGVVDATATFTSRGILREFDVGTESPSRMLSGGFRLAYGDAATPNTMETTECVEAAFSSDADAAQELGFKLRMIKALRTIGLHSVSRRQHRNGYRYSVRFPSSSSGDLLDLMPADASTCEAFAGRTQTIDIRADSTVVQGGYSVAFQDEITTCISATIRASGPTNSLADTLSRVIRDRIIPLQVVKDTSILGPSGVRYYITFMSLSDAIHPIQVRTTNCAAFLCDDGAGGAVTCTGVQVIANAEYKTTKTISSSLAFQYAVQALDRTPALAVRDSSGLTGTVFRYSLNPVLTADLVVPAALLTASDTRILSSDEIPQVVRVFSSTVDDTYAAGDVIVIYVTFTLAVDVVGRPILELNSGGVATYLSGSGTTRLEFRYKVLPGEASADLNYASTLSLRTPGLFVNIVATGSANTPGQQVNADVTLPALAAALSLGSQHALVVSTSPPSIVSVTSSRADIPAGGTGYGVGDIIDIVVVFSSEVAVTGEPTLTLNSGGIAKFTYAGYRQLLDVGVHAVIPVTSGQFAISYRGVVSGCVDMTDPDSGSPTSLKSQLLAFSELATIGIVSVARSRKKNGYRFEITFDSSRVLDVPASVVPVVSDVCGPMLPSSTDTPPERLVERSTDTRVVFHYYVQESDATARLDYTSASVDVGVGYRLQARSRTPVVDAIATLPAAASTNRLSALKLLVVDGSPVVVTDVVADSAAGTYGVAYPPIASPPGIVYPGEIYFRVIFSRSVKVTGSPTMELATGSLQLNGLLTPNRLATFVGQPQPNEAAFLYHIQEGDSSANLAFAGLNVLANAKVFCVSTSSLTLARTTLPRLLVSATKILKIDASSVPTTVKLSSPHPDGVWGAGEAVQIDVTFSKQVTLQTGLNRNHDWYARYPIAVELDRNLVVLWTEWSSYEYKPTVTKSFLYLRVFDSTTLEQIVLPSPVAAVMNRFPNTFIEKVSAAVWKSDLYAAWDEDGVIYCARFNGLAVVKEPWTVIPNMGANKDLQRRGSGAQLVVHNLQLVMLWREEAIVSDAGRIAGQIRLAQRNDDYDAPLWIFHDGNKPTAGLNKDPLQDAILPHAAVYRGAMYVAWSEYTNDIDAYAIVVARRYVQSRDRSVWQYLNFTGTAVSDFYLSSYRPRLAVRRKGFEDSALVVTWYRETMDTGVSEVLSGEVLDFSWTDSGASIARQVNASTSVLPSAKMLDTLACGDTMVAAWIEESPLSAALASRVQTLRIALLKADQSLHAGWSALFDRTTANHNSLFDATDTTLVCSGTSRNPGVLWTEFDGVATKLHLRHALIPQQNVAEQAITWGETTSGTPLLQMDTATTPNGVAFAMDRSGTTAKVLRFLYVVQPGHSSLDLDVLTQQALVMNGAQVRDNNGQLPDFTLFPRSRDSRSLSYNNEIAIDTSPPVVAQVTSTTPSGEYGVGEVILIQVVFNWPVDVTTGDADVMLYLRSDELHFTDYNVNPAVYMSGSGTTTLSFAFTASERDYCEQLDYFRVDSLVIPNGTRIRRNSTFPVVDAVLTLPPPKSARSLSGNRRISIKPTPPAVTDVSSPTPDGTYFPGDTIPIVVTFTLPVVVFGSPVLRLETQRISSFSRAIYEAGNGTTALAFRYVIQEGDTTSDLDVVDDRGSSVINYVLSLELAGLSSIKRKSTNPFTNADVALPAPGWAGSLSRNKNLVIDTVRPKIVDVRSPTPDGTYDIGDTIEILVQFSKRVVVQRAAPYLWLNVPLVDPLEAPRTAVYLDGSGTNVLRFVYTVTARDNTGTIPLDILNERSFLLRPMELGGSMAKDAAQVLCKAAKPELPANLTLPRPGPLLRADAVRSLVGNNKKLFLRTDGLRVVAMDADVKSGDVYPPGQRIVVTVTFSGVVMVQGSPRLKLNANALIPTYAQYIGGSGSTQLRFEYVVATGDNIPVLEAASRSALELPAGSMVTDNKGLYVPVRVGPPLLPGSLSFNYKIGISSTPPTVQRVFVTNSELSSGGAFGVGDDIVIAVQFSARVAMPAGTTAPTLRLAFANSVRSAAYLLGDRSATWLFTIRVIAGDRTASVLDYVDASSLVVAVAPGGLFATATTLVLVANPQLPAVGSSGSLSASRIRVVSAPPTVIAVSALDRDGMYALGDRIRIGVRFSYRVSVVTTAACSLELFLSGDKATSATLVGGSTTSVLVFEYRIVAGDRSGRLDYRSTSSLSCSVLQLTANPSLAADTTLPAPGADGSLGFASRIQVDAAAPRIVSVSSSLANGVYGSGQDINILVTFTEAVEISEVAKCNPKLRLAIANTQQPQLGRVAGYQTGSGTATFVFRYTTSPGAMAFPLAYDGVDALYMDAPDCIILASSASRRRSSIRLPTPRGSGSLSNNRDLQIDGIEPPRIVTVTSDMADGIYTAGDIVTITIVFTTPVTVTGVPYLRLDVGQQVEGRALYQSGSGSTRLVFAYTIQTGDHSDRLDYVRCPDSARQRPRRREFDKLVMCLQEANALQLGAGGKIQRVATMPSVDAVLDLPEVNRWPKLRVATSRQDFVYVNQLEDTTDLPDQERQHVITAEAARRLANEFSMSQQKASLCIYSNGIPREPTPLKVVEQRYFIELTRFPVVQPNPLSLNGFDGFIGVMLNGIPFKNSPSAQTDACGGVIDDQNRYFYSDLPSCWIANAVAALAPSTTPDGVQRNPFLMVGYAFDGVPVYYFYDETGDIPTQLDECNGMRGRDGAYRYHLRPSSSSRFMPCLQAINDSPSAVRGEAAKLLRAFRFPVDIRQVDGLTLSSLSRFEGLVIDENPSTTTGTATWLNPRGVSVVYTATTITVRSTGIPDGAYGPFPNAYNSFVVREQDYAFQLPRQPVVAARTTALPVDAPVGVMLNGVPFFSSQSIVYKGNIMDPKSRAYWMLDKCHGLVDAGGNYRYYGTPDCLLSELGGKLTPGQPSPMLGYALDGFPLYGPYTESGVAPTDLDACNGRVGDDGTYRYHVTPGKAPYLIGCFAGTPLFTANDEVQRSLSYAKALRIDTQRPHITQIFTNKHPGIYTLSETLDLVVVWSHPVIVDVTNGVPTLMVPGSMQQPQAIFKVTKSTPTQSVFEYSVTPTEAALLEYNYDFRSAIQLNGATIKRAAATPTVSADLQLLRAERNSRFVSKHQLIKDLRVVLRGLYHPHASDLSVNLFHDTRKATIVDRCCGHVAFGVPDDQLRINNEQLHIFPDNPTSGVGWDYGFQDFAALKNLARDGGATALQSGTSGSCHASNAIDGRVGGTVSRQDVAQATSSSTTFAWWELRLLKPVEIGTIRVWLPQQPERLPAVVQILKVDSADGVSQVYGSFALSLTAWDGGVSTTTRINWNAVAMVRDEDGKIAALGVGKGESLEAKILAAMPSTSTQKQRLYVTRSPASALLSNHGAFTWSITFLQDPQLYAEGSVPLSVHVNQICDGLGVVTLDKPLPGDDRDEWVYLSRDGTQRPGLDSSKGVAPMFPFWILLFEDTSVMSVESFHEAVNASTWSYRVDESMSRVQMVSVNPPVGLKMTQFIRIVAETPSAVLTLAEVEIFTERNHVLSQYASGAPVATQFYPSAETWSPEDSFRERFSLMASEGRWTLSIHDHAITYQESADQASTHGAGAVSDWVLYVTNLAGNTRTYYMDIHAHIKTLPRHGKLYVAIAETDSEHLDRDRNGVLDLVEAETYLSSYYLSFDVLPTATRQRVLWNFLTGYTKNGGIEILTDPSERQKMDPSHVCDQQCLEDLNLDPFYWPGTTGDRALKPMSIGRDRVVRYVPRDGFLGLDTFTFAIAIGSQESAVRGTVELNVQECQDKSCIMDSALLHRMRINE